MKTISQMKTIKIALLTVIAGSILISCNMQPPAEATAAGFMKLSEAKVLDGIESWGPMAIASGRLVVRDLKKMTCLDITEK